jgi:uncharacterized protein (DUF2336 family)
MHNDLLDLARENSAEARGALMLGLTDFLVTSIDKRTNAELEMFGEVALLLYRSAPSTDRGLLSRKVAAEPRTPLPLALALASDQIHIALPVLEHFSAFNEKNLLALARKLGDEHLQVLARRKDLDRSVSSTLARRGSKHVHRILAGNREIRLSDITLKALVRHAMQDVVLREDLVLRHDLTPAVCNMLLPHVEGAARERLQKMVRGALSRTDLGKLARLRQLRRDHGTQIDQRDGKELLAYIEKTDITLDELIVLLLQDERLTHVADIFGHLNRKTSTTARHALFNGNLEMVVEMALGAGISSDTFSLLAKARCKQLRIPTSQAAEWIKALVEAKRSTTARPKRRGDGAFAAKRPLRPRREGPRRLAKI